LKAAICTLTGSVRIAALIDDDDNPIML